MDYINSHFPFSFLNYIYFIASIDVKNQNITHFGSNLEPFLRPNRIVCHPEGRFAR
jgi:hypothetical protein